MGTREGGLRAGGGILPEVPVCLRHDTACKLRRDVEFLRGGDDLQHLCHLLVCRRRNPYADAAAADWLEDPGGHKPLSLVESEPAAVMRLPLGCPCRRQATNRRSTHLETLLQTIMRRQAEEYFSMVRRRPA